MLHTSLADVAMKFVRKPGTLTGSIVKLDDQPFDALFEFGVRTLFGVQACYCRCAHLRILPGQIVLF